MSAKYDYYQSPSHINLAVYRKNIGSLDNLSIDATQTSLRITHTPSSELVLDLPYLYADIIPDNLQPQVFSTKLSLTIPKSIPASWPTLTRDPSIKQNDIKLAQLPTMTQPESTSQPQPATKRKPNKFDNISLSDDEEGGSKKDSEKDVDAFFKTLYGDMSEDSKRAMMKSYVESKGTVLSTDWSDIGNRKVEPAPPSGTETKKY